MDVPSAVYGAYGLKQSLPGDVTPTLAFGCQSRHVHPAQDHTDQQIREFTFPPRSVEFHQDKSQWTPENQSVEEHQGLGSVSHLGRPFCGADARSVFLSCLTIRKIGSRITPVPHAHHRGHGVS